MVLHFVEEVGSEVAVETRVQFVDPGMSAESQLAFRHEIAHTASVELRIFLSNAFVFCRRRVTGVGVGDALDVAL